MRLRILPQVAKELQNEPLELRQSIYGSLERVERGDSIGMPLCKSLFSIARGLYELRLSSRAGEYRAFYYIKVRDAVYAIHAMRKKSQKMEKRTINLLLSRIRSLS